MITTAQLKRLAELAPWEKRAPGRPTKGAPLDVRKWCDAHLPNPTIKREKEWQGWTIYELAECPFDPSHNRGEACIMQSPSGALAFKCWHASCAHHDWKALRELCDPKGQPDKGKAQQEVDVELTWRAEERGKPQVNLTDRQLEEVIHEVSEHITAKGQELGDPLVYQRGGVLVRIVRDSEYNPHIDILDAASMAVVMSQACDFNRVSRGDSGPTVLGCFPPQDLCRAMIKYKHWVFPSLKGIVEIPAIRESGTIIDAKGYDAESRLYYAPRGDVLRVDKFPTQADGAKSAAQVLDLLSDFPFKTECDRDNMVGLLTTCIVKEFVGLAPMGIIDAPSQGTGKGKLAQLVSIVAAGRELPVSTEVKDEEEWRKQITSLLIADRPVVIIDNVERTLYQAQLAAVLTSAEWSDRLLGRNETLALPNRAIWVATGNNIALGGDIPRRSYKIRLDANMARPWTRDPRAFKHELPSWAIEHREEIVSWLLTMARAWALGGMPEWSGRPIGSYERWSRVVGGILEYCGVKNFLANIEELYEEAIDEDPIQWSGLIEALFCHFGDQAFSIKDLFNRSRIEMAEIFKSMPDSLEPENEKALPKKLGWGLKRRKDQIFETSQGAVRLKRSGRDGVNKTLRWRLEPVKSDGGLGDFRGYELLDDTLCGNYLINNNNNNNINNNTHTYIYTDANPEIPKTPHEKELYPDGWNFA